MAFQRGAFATMSNAGAYSSVVQDFTTEAGGEREEVTDASGNVSAYDSFNKTANVSFDTVWDTGDAMPAYGATFTVAGSQTTNGVFTCDGSTVTENNKAYTRATVRGIRFLENSLPA